MVPRNPAQWHELIPDQMAMQSRPLREFREFLNQLRRNGVASDRVAKILMPILDSKVVTQDYLSLGFMHDPNFVQTVQNQFAGASSSTRFPQALCTTSFATLYDDWKRWYRRALTHRWRFPRPLDQYPLYLDGISPVRKRLSHFKSIVFHEMFEGTELEMRQLNDLNGILSRLDHEFSKLHGAILDGLLRFIHKQDSCMGPGPYGGRSRM
jgi:hypothetical protein